MKISMPIIIISLIINVLATPVAAQKAGVKNYRIDMTAENRTMINKAINDARREIGMFLSFNTLAPKLSDAYENCEGSCDVYKSKDWIIEIAQEKIQAKAYFKEEGKAVSEFGEGDVEIALRFEFECNNGIIKEINFYGFNFEKKIVWVELLP
jgi:hypothetical protein